MTIRAYRPRQKACRHCEAAFTATRPMQHACGVDCAIAIARAKREKAESNQAKRERVAKRAEKAAARAKLKTRGDYLKECQQAFNAWVRERDHAEPCISCQRHHAGQYQAGHYLTVGAHPELRFEPDNCHKQCAPCNNHLSGNLIEYRKGLMAKIGQERVEWLEGPHEPKKYGIDDLKAMTGQYRVAARQAAKVRMGEAG